MHGVRLAVMLAICLAAHGARAQEAAAPPRAWLTLRLEGAVERVEIRPVREFVVSNEALSTCTARDWRTCQVFLPRGEYALVALHGDLAASTGSFYLGKDTSMEVRGRVHRSPAVRPLLITSLVGMGIAFVLACSHFAFPVEGSDAPPAVKARGDTWIVPMAAFFGVGAALGITGLILNDQQRLDLNADVDAFGRREATRTFARSAPPIGLGFRGVF